MANLSWRSVCIIVMIVILVYPTSAASRRDGVSDFVQSTRVSDDGFANSVGGSLSLDSTVDAMRVHAILQEDLNNSVDILYYFQKLQDSTGGFAQREDTDPDLESTITAIYGFQYLDINQSQYSQWQIFPYLNSSASDVLLNETSLELYELTGDLLKLWVDYLVTSSLLGDIPTIPFIELIDAVKALQYINGSYQSFEVAVGSIKLLDVLGEEPTDPDLAEKYIRTFSTSDGLFSSEHEGMATLSATFTALNALSSLINLGRLEEKSDITRSVFDLQVARSGFSEVGSSFPTIDATLNAMLVLQLLGELDELSAPDVLQEVGFVSYPFYAVILTYTVILLSRRRLK